MLTSGNLAPAVQLAHPDPEVRDEADGRRPHPPGTRPPLGHGGRAAGGSAGVPGQNSSMLLRGSPSGYTQHLVEVNLKVAIVLLIIQQR